MAKSPDEIRNKWKSLLPQVTIKRLNGIHFMQSVNPLSRMAGFELHEAEHGLESFCEVDGCTNVAEWNDMDGIWVFHCMSCVNGYMESKKEPKKELPKTFTFEQDYGWMDYADERRAGCSCHTGHPPCSYCTDRNYCEDCDEATWEDKCERCGVNLSIEDVPFHG